MREMFISLIARLFELDYKKTMAVGTILDTVKKLFTDGIITTKKLTAAFTAIVELFSMIYTGAPLTPRGQQLDLSDYSLVFCDDFDGTQVDLDKWEYRGSGVNNDGYNAPSQIKLADGNMVITGEYLENGQFGPGWYAGDINIKQQFTHGYFEIRCICNPGGGYYSAFWLNGDNGQSYDPARSKGGLGCCEMDVFEAMYYGQKYPNSICTHLYCSGRTGDTSGELNAQNLGCFYGNDIYNQYNTYGLEWTDKEYIFYINGVETIRSSWCDGVSQNPEDVIVSMEIPRTVEYEDKNYKTQMLVDYVKVYQKAGDIGR